MHRFAIYLFRIIAIGTGLGLAMSIAHGQQGICARVVIQIEQEMTLEREGFEARLGVTNGQPTALENFRVTLKFLDAEQNPVAVSTDSAPDSNGKFYYRVQSGFTVPTTIPSGADKKIAYLIVPSPGAAGMTASGSLYYVGATIKYTVAGEEQTVEVASDHITVRPMPVLQLQYFLPGNVYGDDPMTDAVEPIVPYELGVRVSNHSAYATAKKVNIQSGQPEIIENKQDLLIDFRIVGCEVNGGQAQPSLLVNFGDIGPNRAAVANWWMTSSLSGRFVKFTAEVEHAPEFGGALTSLIPEDSISTYRLLGRVLVDLPGRDTALDFLATDSMTGEYNAVKVCESDNDIVSAPVDYYPPGNDLVSLTGSSASYALSISATSSMLYARMASPIPRDQVVKAVRSDGKKLPASNCWVSKNKNDSGTWVYWLNLFDTGKTLGQSYALVFSEPSQTNRPPELTIVGGRSFSVSVGQSLTISTSATDPDGLIPSLSTGDLPDGASFVDRRDGHGTFSWKPTSTQTGSYSVQFRASDGIDTDAKSATIQVSTGYVGYAGWAEHYWPGVTDPNIVGQHADPDGDQIDNLLEYALGGDPTVLDDSILPAIGSEIVSGHRVLTLTYLHRTDDTTLLYEVIGSDSLFAPLATWTVQPQAIQVDQTNVPAGMERIKISDSVPIESGPSHRYLRLRVTTSQP